MKKSIAQKSAEGYWQLPKEEFSGKNLTRFGGTGLIRRLFVKLKVAKELKEVSVEGRRRSTYSPKVMCICILYALMLGIFRPSHMSELVKDGVFRRLAGLRRFPVQSTISRFLNGVRVATVRQVEGVNWTVLSKFRKNFRDLVVATLDLDSHVTTVYGKQQRAKKGYNPKKHGRKSYHPLLCFPGETRDCLGAMLRPGNCVSSAQARGFLTLILRKLPSHLTLRLRADSGFFDLKFIGWLRRREIEFYIVVPQLLHIQKLIRAIGLWRDVGGGYEVGETVLPDGPRKVRLVVIRKAVKAGEKPRKQLKLFTEWNLRYDFQVIATSSREPGEVVWHCYNQRACCENFIKEGIYGFGMDKSICHLWAGARLYLQLVILAYNLMNWFKESALARKERKEMATTLRWRLFLIPARLVKSGRSFTLKLADWWEHQSEYERAVAALG